MNSETPVTRRERELLKKLETIRLQRKKITKAGFCREMGYANKSALRHFPILMRELDLYVCSFTPKGGRSSPSPIRLLQKENERLVRRCEQQQKEMERIPILEDRVAKLTAEIKRRDNLLARFRGMISALIAHFVGKDLTGAQEISAQLKDLATAVMTETDESGSGRTGETN